MNKDRVKVWVKALRSGEYSQATGSLRVGGDEWSFAYCCLGVACDVLYEEDWEFRHTGKWSMPSLVDDYNTGLLPAELAADLELTQAGTFTVDVGVNAANIEGVLERFPGAKRIWEATKREAQLFKGITKIDYTLTVLNDNHEFTFSEVADVLEAALELPEVFDFRTPFEEFKSGATYRQMVKLRADEGVTA